MLRKDVKPGQHFQYVNVDYGRGMVFVCAPDAKTREIGGVRVSTVTERSELWEQDVRLVVSEPLADPTVTSLPYYTRNKIEAIDVIEAWGLDYPLGCVLKYLSRHGHKPGADAKEDLLKARAYITRAINRLDGKSSWDAPGGANA